MNRLICFRTLSVYWKHITDFDRLGGGISKSLFSTVCVCLLKPIYDNVWLIVPSELGRWSCMLKWVMWKEQRQIWRKTLCLIILNTIELRRFSEWERSDFEIIMAHMSPKEFEISCLSQQHVMKDKMGYIYLHVNQQFGYKTLIICLHYAKDWKKFHL